MTTARDETAPIRVGWRGRAGSPGPHFAPPAPATGRPRAPLPPWRRWVRKGLVLLGLLGGGALVPPERRDAPRVDADAAAERASFEVAEGFEVNLFAADPLLAKPTQMNFDARGRLWVACSEAYPQIRPDAPANDRIVVLEDADGDGTAEKADVFADGLLIPTGVEPGDGGAYVGAGTDLLHFRDNDGDGRADERRVILSGFGTEDTHHTIHTLRWGPDGALYFNQSLYIHSHVETPWGVQRLAGGGIWRFEPGSQFLSVFARGWLNPWGHAFDRWGQSFVTDGAGGHGINHAIPGGAYDRAVGASRTLAGLNPGSPKLCGAEVLSGRHLPDDLRGRILSNDFRANNVRRFALPGDGSTFRSLPEVDLIRTRYQAFRPIDIKMGPDGAVYIADWYNPIINHGEVDFRDPRRDHTRGRIWRVTARGRPLVPRPDLVGAGVADLLDHLKAPEDWTRHFARRVLVGRGRAAVEGPLRLWVDRLDPADPEADHHRLEALWTMEALGAVAPDLLDRVLAAGRPEARAAACRVVAHWLGRLDAPFDRLAPRVVDADPRVRLEAVRALGMAPEVRAAALALRALDRPLDPTLDFALATTLRSLQPFWHPALAANLFDYGDDARKLVYALEAVGSTDAVRPLVAALRAGKVPPEQEDQARALIANLGGPAELAPILDLALDPATPDARRAGLLALLADAAARRQVRPDGDLRRITPWLDPTTPPATRLAAIRLVGAWRLEELRDRVAALATEPGVAGGALGALAALGGDRSVAILASLAAPPHPLAIRWLAAGELARLDLGLAATRAVAALGGAGETGTGTDLDPTRLFDAFLGRSGGADALIAALSEGSPAPTIATSWAEAGTRAATRAGLPPDSPLVAALNRAGGLAPRSGRREWSRAERAAIVADVPRRGDPARGEAIFRRANLQCLNCHAIAGAGGRVGPGLESLGASAPVDYLVDSLVEPDKAVKEGYGAVVVATDDGRVVTGIRVGQTDASLVLRTAEDREVAVPLGSIDEQKPAGSLMPAGLVDGLSRAEVVDLVRFLGELGKLGPYAVRPEVRLARRYSVPAPRPTDPIGPLAALATAPGDAWAPACSTVAGWLPSGEIPPVPTTSGAALIARTEIEVGTAGTVRLVVAPPDAAVWVDDRPAPPAGSPGTRDVPLAVGPHRVTIAAPGGTVPGLRLELRDAPGSPALARPAPNR